MRDRLKLPLEFDPDAMRADLLGLEQDAWIEHYVKQNYEGAWTVLPLRAPSGASHPVAAIYADPSAEAYVDTPLLSRCAYFGQVLAAFQCPLEAVRLMKLGPGSVVKPHRDHDLAAEFGRARLHIPVVTNPDVEFWLNRERVILREGECWYLELSGTHWVANRGQTDRIHLVVDAVVNGWLEEQLAQAERANPASAATSAAPVSPAPSALEEFRKAVQCDLSLQRRLCDVEDREAFIATAIRLAAESGLQTTADEIDRAMRETRRRARLR